MLDPHQFLTFVRIRYQYLLLRKESDNMPSVWMPRKSDIRRFDSGLDEARRRNFDSMTSLCNAAGLIEFREWNYLERQHDLMVALKEYADVNFDGNYTIFPLHENLLKQPHLHRLVQDFGGTTFVAGKLGMQRQTTMGPSIRLNWGPFDLEYGIALLDFVRYDQMQKNPPIEEPAIFMPTHEQFLESAGRHGDYLHGKTIEYGGYESVARRLGLEWKGDLP